MANYLLETKYTFLFLNFEFTMPNFTRTIEDFVCENCGTVVKGNGYTNHCPKCLYSKHVDVNPGDRLNACNGLMKPIKVEMEQGEYIITHRCLVCGMSKRNKTDELDDMNAIIKLASGIANSGSF